MDFKRYYRSLSKQEKMELADFLGVCKGTMYAIGGGFAKPGPKNANKIVEFSQGQVTLEEVRPDWFKE